MKHSNTAIADRIARRRARVVTALAIYFIASQALYFTKAAKFDALSSMSTVDGVHIAAWFALALALLIILFTGGGWLQTAEVRALLDDESTREHRQKAMSVGFIAAMANAIALYVLTMFEPISGREAVHLTMTVGIGAALLCFGTLERRALSNG